MAAAPRLRGYEILSALGRGGMGQVFLAQDQRLDRRVAIKVIVPSLAGEATARARFLREARVMAGIEHPHVVRVYALGESRGRPYIVMEYVQGSTLADRLLRSPVLDVALALRLAHEVAQALAAAWSHGIVHRDVKPSNILLDLDERARVADFGLARRAGSREEGAISSSGVVVGTPQYLAPELARGEEPDFRSDVYSLGIVLWEMLVGERPFRGGSAGEILARQLSDPVPPLSARRPDLPGALDALVRSMTAKSPDERPPSYSELRTRLSFLSGDESDQVTLSFARANPPRRPPPRSRPRAWRLAWAALLLIGLAAAAWWAGPRHRASFAVAVAPLRAPDAESDKQGRVMTALIEGELLRSLPEDGVAVLGPEEVGRPIRSEGEARRLAERLDADLVIWGDAILLGDEVVLAPRLTRRSGGAPPEPASLSLRVSAPNGIERRREHARSLARSVEALLPRAPGGPGR